MKTTHFLLSLIILPLCLSACFRLSDKPATTERAPSSLVMGPEDDVRKLQKTSQTMIRLGDRQYIASVLTNVFGTGVQGIIDANILNQQRFFGGPSDAHYEKGDVLAAMVPSSTSARESLRTQACNLIVQNDLAIQNAATQARSVELNQSDFLTKDRPVEADIKSAYDLFMPGRIPSAEVITSLKTDVVDYSAHAGLALIESWRFLFLTLCLSPGWQVQ